MLLALKVSAALSRCLPFSPLPPPPPTQSALTLLEVGDGVVGVECERHLAGLPALGVSSPVILHQQEGDRGAVA